MFDMKNWGLSPPMTQNVALQNPPGRHGSSQWEKSFPQAVEKIVEKNAAYTVSRRKKACEHKQNPMFSTPVDNIVEFLGESRGDC